MMGTGPIRHVGKGAINEVFEYVRFRPQHILML